MNNEQYLVLVGDINQIISIPPYHEIDFIKKYIDSEIIKYHFQEFSHLNKVLCVSPYAERLTGVCKKKGTPIRGNAVICLGGNYSEITLSGMSKAMSEIAFREILFVHESRKYISSYLELGE